MNIRHQTPKHSAHKLDPNLKFLTITHPGHRYYGEVVSVVRAHRNKPLAIIVSLPTGERVTVPVGWTDYEQNHNASTPTKSMLDIKGLLEVVGILEQEGKQKD